MLKTMTTIERKTPTTLLVNGKTINLKGEEILEKDKLDNGELKAVRNFVQATKRLKIKSSVLP